MPSSSALDSWFNRLTVSMQSCVIMLGAVIGADLLTLVFYSIFFADRLLLDLFLTSVIVVVVGSPLTVFFMSRSARLAELAAQLDRANRVDDLTGVLNRKTFLHEAARNLEADKAGSGALLFIDVDHFKQVNDTKGHAAGDAVLRAMGAVLKACIREDDLVGRFGGEEFAILLKSAGLRHSTEVCERIRQAVKGIGNEVELGRRELTVSIGVAAHLPGQDLDQLIAAADRNLYAAKSSGRDRAVFPAAVRVVA